jgi:hypothetical protein
VPGVTPVTPFTIKELRTGLAGSRQSHD